LDTRFNKEREKKEKKERKKKTSETPQNFDKDTTDIVEKILTRQI
jgi:hypothetical protein